MFLTENVTEAVTEVTEAVSAAADKITIGEAGVYALLGYVVVFFGICLLMAVVMIMGKIFVAKDRKAKAAQAAPKPLAPGSAGELKLHDVEPKTAAMIMAIVADKLHKPLNELRFISIKEVK